jgi:protease IV
MGRINAFLGFVWRVLDRVRRAVHLLVMLAVAAVILTASHRSLPMVPSKAALVVRFDGRLVEQSSEDALGQSIRAVSGSDAESQVLLRDVVAAIRTAAKDARIRALVLETENLAGGGLTKYRSVAEAIDAFRHSGKPVYAHGRYVSQDQYYLLAQADHAYLDPAGLIDVTGYAAYGLYFRDALEKLGVTVNVFKVGTHKSFTEPFTRSDQSPEDREQTLGWIKPLWTTYRTDIEHRRHLKEGTLDHYVNDAVALMKSTDGDAAKLAQQQGLVEALKTRLEFDKEIAGLVGEDTSTHSFTAIDADAYVDATESDRQVRHPAGEVAVIVAQGEIVTGERGPGAIGGDTLAGLLRDARFDDDVKAVVLRIDSGGGSMLASEIIRQEVAALKAAGKPVVASFSSVAASGGYYIAMEADEIWASPTTITGSIGVFGMVPTFERTLGKLGVASDGVATSPLAGGLEVDRALTPETKAVMQLGVEHAYREFVGRVAATRKKDPAAIEAIAEGRVWIGHEAQQRGLVDHLGDLDGAVRAAAARAQLPADRYAVTWLEKELSWKQKLLRAVDTSAEGVIGRWSGRAIGPSTVRAVTAAQRQLRAIEALNDPRRIYAYCGCDLR